MSEGGAVGVADGYVLRESEADGCVSDGECRELDGVDGELRVSGLENCEIDDERGGD